MQPTGGDGRELIIFCQQYKIAMTSVAALKYNFRVFSEKLKHVKQSK